MIRAECEHKWIPWVGPTSVNPMYASYLELKKCTECGIRRCVIGLSKGGSEFRQAIEGLA